MVDGAEREEGPEAGEVQPTLLQELANVDPPSEVSVDDGVILDGEDEGAAGDDDDEAPARAAIPTATKVVVVAAAWLLLTLFLVDRFSDDPAVDGSTRLDRVAAGEDEHEAPADDEQGGDGDESDYAGAEDLGAGEAGAGAGAYGEAVAVAGADPVAGGTGGGGVYPGVPAQVSGGVGGGSATTAPSTGATTTTTTVAPAGGGGSTNTTAAPAPAPAATIRISWNGFKNVYDYTDVKVPSGSVVRMINDSLENHTWKIGQSDTPISPGASFDRTFTASVPFGCSLHPYMKGKITVT